MAGTTVEVPRAVLWAALGATPALLVSVTMYLATQAGDISRLKDELREVRGDERKTQDGLASIDVRLSHVVAQVDFLVKTAK